MNRKTCEVALRSSYYIYTQRNYNWKEIEILKFYELQYVYFFLYQDCKENTFFLR